MAGLGHRFDRRCPVAAVVAYPHRGRRLHRDDERGPVGSLTDPSLASPWFSTRAFPSAGRETDLTATAQLRSSGRRTPVSPPPSVLVHVEVVRCGRPAARDPRSVQRLRASTRNSKSPRPATSNPRSGGRQLDRRPRERSEVHSGRARSPPIVITGAVTVGTVLRWLALTRLPVRSPPRRTSSTPHSSIRMRSSDGCLQRG